MKTAKQLAEMFGNMNPDAQVWMTWVDKDDLAEIINNSDLTDENDEIIQADKELITDSFLDDVMDIVGNADYIWDRYNEELSDTTRTLYLRALEYHNQNKEPQLLDQELWDIDEGEDSVTEKND
jgi:hypothetical protein